MIVFHEGVPGIRLGYPCIRSPHDSLADGGRKQRCRGRHRPTGSARVTITLNGWHVDTTCAHLVIQQAPKKSSGNLEIRLLEWFSPPPASLGKSPVGGGPPALQRVFTGLAGNRQVRIAR